MRAGPLLRRTGRVDARSPRSNPMRFSYAESMCDVFQLGPLAQAAEEAGYDSVTVPDSI